MFGSYYAGLPYAGESGGIAYGVDLVIADALHSHLADGLILVQQHTIVVQDALHGHTADNLVLIEAKLLAVQDALHAHFADNLVLTQAHTIAIQEALHGHTADNLTLLQLHLLAIQDALHGHLADSPFVSISTDLIIQDTLHGHTAEGIVIYLHVNTSPNPPNVEKTILQPSVDRDNLIVFSHDLSPPGIITDKDPVKMVIIKSEKPRFSIRP